MNTEAASFLIWSRSFGPSWKAFRPLVFGSCPSKKKRQTFQIMFLYSHIYCRSHPNVSESISEHTIHGFFLVIQMLVNIPYMDIQWYTWSIWEGLQSFFNATVSISEHLAQETLDLAVASDGTQVIMPHVWWRSLPQNHKPWWSQVNRHYPLVNIQKAIENGHIYSEFSH